MHKLEICMKCTKCTKYAVAGYGPRSMSPLHLFALYAKICKICMHEIHMPNMHNYLLMTIFCGNSPIAGGGFGSQSPFPLSVTTVAAVPASGN